MTLTMLTIAVIVLALIFDFLNGIHDSSNVVATMISSRALPPRVALGMTAIANFIGPFIFGVAVAETIGGVVNEDTIYVLKRVLFDWTDEEAAKILTNCRRAMKSNARLLIIEPLIGPPNEPCAAHLFDMTFLVMLHGRLRAADEYSALLGQAGFRLQRVVPTESEVLILESFVA